MALDVFAGQFQIGTGAAASTVAVTGVGFTPKIVFFKWSGRTSNGQAEGDHKFGFGAMTGASNRCGITSQSDHTPTTMATDAQVFDDACIKLLTITGAVDGAADFSAFGADGFTVVIDDQFAADYTIDYLALGGSDLTNVDARSFTKTLASGTGNASHTGVGFQPDCVLVLVASSGAINTSAGISNFSLGVAAGGSIATAVLCGSSDDAQATSRTMNYCRSGETFAACTADLVVTRGAVNSFLSDGFQMNWTEQAADATFAAICLKGGSYFVGDILSQTGTSNTGETGVGFQPKALIFGSHNNTASTADTVQAGDQRSLGFATAAAQNFIGVHDKDNSGLADIGVAQNTTGFYVNQDAAATVAVEGVAGLVSMDSDGFTFAHSDADPSQCFIWYLAMGNTPVAGGASQHRVIGGWGGRMISG